MPKLFAYGCSYTYGHGLEDCIIGKCDPGLEPSKLGYASLVSQHLNANELLNYSRPGTSNKWIVNAINVTVESQQIGKNDAVIIQWTFLDRTCVLKKGSHRNLDKYEPLGTWLATKKSLSSAYYKHLYNIHDSTHVTSWYIKYVDLLLKSHGITKVLHTALPDGEVDMKVYLPDTIKWWDDNISRNRIDKAIDGSHPGPESQKLFADKLFKEHGDYLS